MLSMRIGHVNGYFYGPFHRLPIQVADPTTFRVLSWAPTTGWLLCDVYFNDGRPLKR
jgi:hypothetical protein